MANTAHKFVLSAAEAQSLQKALEGNERLTSLVFTTYGPFVGRIIVEMDHDTCQEVRECLTEKLVQIGFDLNYSLTTDGALLEGLIDKFYIP
jgi:hypothetical protein